MAGLETESSGACCHPPPPTPVQGILLPASAFPRQSLTSCLATLEQAARQVAAAPGEEGTKAALATAVAVLRLHLSR